MNPRESHAFQRLRERYGIKFSDTMRDSLVKSIRTKKAVKISLNTENNTEIFDIEYKLQASNLGGFFDKVGHNCKFRVVWNYKEKFIVTFLSLKMNPLIKKDNKSIYQSK